MLYELSVNMSSAKALMVNNCFIGEYTVVLKRTKEVLKVKSAYLKNYL